MKRRASAGRRWVGPLIGLVTALAAVPLLESDLLQSFEYRTVDARMKLRGTAPAAPEIAVCSIDARSIDQLGQWPWPRSTVAGLIDRLSAGGARAIAIDVIFSEPSRLGVAEDEALARSIRQAGNVVLGFYLTQEAAREDAGAPSETVLPLPIELAVEPPSGYPAVPSFTAIETNIPALARAAPAAGHFVIQPSADGTIRHYSMILEHQGVFYPSLALRAVQRFLGSSEISLQPDQGRLPLIRLGQLQIPASERGELWINFRGPFGRTFDYHSAVDVLNGTVPPDAFADRLVFIGATEIGIGDTKTSPFNVTVPGVEIHATVADNLIHRRFIRDSSTEVALSILAILVLGPVSGLLAVRFRRAWSGAALWVVLVGLYALLSQFALTIFSRHLHLFLPLVAGAVAYTGAVVWRTLFAEKRARQIRKTFSHYVSASVVEEMLKDPDKVHLGGEKRDLTVLFSDIRGFTSLSERLSPDEVVSLLNAYLTPMTRIVLECGGTLDKYMGDAIMAFFGAPVTMEDHPRRACHAALAMRACMVDLEHTWQDRGLPVVTSGIGINSGPMSVGNMGSDMIFDYTVIGDHVNLGSRLEGLTKPYGVEIVTSEYTVARVEQAFCFRELDQVRVKGKQQPVRIYELFGAAQEAAAVRPFLDAFAAALEVYRRGDFPRAEELFKQAAGQRPADPPTALYLRRLAKLQSSPPDPDWDGVTNLTQK